jgi:7-cyano-7-deazaguanine synthase
MKKAVCLLSGGLDSSTVLAIVKSEGYGIYALTVDYGQRHRREIRAADSIAKYYGVLEHKLIKVPLSKFGGSSLTDKNMPLPENRKLPGGEPSIPSTYVPARNMIFLSLAFAYAEAKKADAVFIGANAIDYSGYPDCRPDFFNAFRKALAKGTKSGKKIRLETPLVRMTKAQIIKTGTKLGVPYRLTWSCYRGGKRPCGRCDSCILRARGFRQAGMKDPLIHEKTTA